MLPTKFIYAELTLDSKKRLEKILPYRYEIHYGSYITLDWEVDFDLYRDLIGKSYKLNVNKLHFDDKIEAIYVDIKNSTLRSVNKNPHITWSGVKEINPYYSNYLLYVSDSFVEFDPVEIEVVVKTGIFN